MPPLSHALCYLVKLSGMYANVKNGVLQGPAEHPVLKQRDHQVLDYKQTFQQGLSLVTSSSPYSPAWPWDLWPSCHLTLMPLYHSYLTLRIPPLPPPHIHLDYPRSERNRKKQVSDPFSCHYSICIPTL
jgi:hypothetical protein